MTTENLLHREAAELEYNPNEVIIKFKSGVQTADVATLQTHLSATTLETTQTLGAQLWQIRGMTADEAVAAYANDPRVEYIVPNYLRSLAQTPDAPSFGQLWGLNNTGQTGGTPDADIDAPEAWDIATGSSDVVVGVIDTGVDYNHPDLAANIWTNPGETAGDGIDNDGNGYVDDVHGYDFSDGDSDPLDYDGHGTHVSGTIGAVGDNGTGVVGASWSPKIMALKIFPNPTDFNIIQAIEYSANMGVKVTNNSWGGGPPSAALEDAIAYAGSLGQLFIAAAGNFSQDNDTNPFYPASFDLDNIISVAATDHNDLKAGFSHYGATSVDLGAPGVAVYSTLPGNNYGFLSGTSMASPHVAGVTALLWSQYPDLTAAEIKETLLGTVDPIAALDGLTVSGGRLNADHALLGPVAASISGSKWNDLDGDGTRDANEPGLANWTIYLDADNDGTLDDGETSTVTDADGNYAFKFLDPGDYTVTEVQKPGWTQTSSPETYNLNVAQNQDIENIDFGNQLTNPASISGRKWNDVDRNGIQDHGEVVLSGWTIYLDTNKNGELDDGELSDITDTDGEYSFENLEPGTYTVAEVQQPSWTQTSPVLGTLGEVFNADFSDASGNPDLDGFTVDNTGGTVAGLWHLSTGRGNQPGHSADDSLYFGTGEGVDGGGNYNVGHTAGRITSPIIDLTAISSAELSFNYFLASEGGNPWDSARVLISQDGGVFEAIASNVSELVDPTTGWTNATVDLTPYTGSNIEIRFDFDTSDNINNTFEGWYVDDILISEVGNGTHTLKLAADETATDINFGNAQQEPGEIHGYKWRDRDGDGEWDTNESALSGWTIYLDNNQNGELDEDEPSDITDANGEYSFTELVPGTYTVAEVQQEGWTQTSPGGNNGAIEPDDYTNATVLNTIQPGVTLSAVGSGVTNNQVLSQTSTYSSTGTQNFNNSAFVWYNDVAEFRADFDTATSSVSIDFISDDSSDIGQLEAYDGDGNLLETYTTAALTTGQSETMTITRDSADIAYILATGQDGFSIGYLDRLVFSSADFHTVEVGDGEIVTDVNFGNQEIIPGEIHGIKWNDIDGDGTQDEDEPGLEGWTIYLDDNQNGQLDVGEESTLTDTNGEYAFTNLAAGTYTVAEEQQSGWQQTYPVLNTPISSTLIPVVNRKDLVYDDSRDLLYITTADGDVERYDPTTQTLLTPWDVGNVLNGADITTDGSTLYVAEGQRGATQGFIRKLNLDNGNVTNLTYNLYFGEGGAWDINIASNGKALFTTNFEGSGWTPLREIDLSNDAMTIRTDSDGATFGGEVRGESRIHRSRERNLFFITEPNSSRGPIFTYDAVTDTFPNSSDTNTYLSNGGAVNADGSQIALRLGNGVSIFDRDLNSIENLSNVGAGLVFDPNQDVLYTADADADWVVAFDTETWDELYRLDIGEDIDTFDPFYSFQQIMEVSDNGQFLFLGTPSGVRMFDLSSFSTPIPHTVELNTSEIVTDINFGNQEQRGTISGSKWNDLDGDGTRDTGEPGLANWTIYLDDNNNSVLDAEETSTITDELGNYSFSLEAGTYTVAEVLEPEWVQTYPVGGTHTVELDTAEELTNIDFGNRPAINVIMGTSGNDSLSGTPFPDDISGLAGNDVLRGLQDDDILRGGGGNDSLYGGGYEDDLLGNAGNDVMYGGRSNDTLRGGVGADVLTGVDILDVLPGVGEIDRLTGNADADTFALGDSLKVYYNDDNNTSSGINDYGLILDFAIGTDTIQLRGNASNYVLATSPMGLPPGTAIFLETGTTDELIGIVRNIPLSQLNLTSSSFSYV